MRKVLQISRDRPLPQLRSNVTAEFALLGHLIRSSNPVAVLDAWRSRGVTDSTFTGNNKLTWQTCCRLRDRGHPLDLAVIAAEILPQHSDWSMSEYAGLPVLSDPEPFISLLLEYERRRQLVIDIESLRDQLADSDPLEQITAFARSAIERAAVPATLSGYDFDSLPSVWAMQDVELEYAIDRLIVMSGITAVSGDSGSGKSTLLTYIGWHISVGSHNCMGRKCTQRPVLILDHENSAPFLKARLRLLREVRDGGNFRIDVNPPAIDSPALLAWVEKCNPKPVIMLDAFNDFFDGDENDAKVVVPFFRPVRRLANAGAGVVVLCNTGKGENTKDFRGSSVLKDKIDAGIHVTNNGGRVLDRLRLREWKRRAGVDANLTLRYVDEAFECESDASSQPTVTERLADLYRQNPGLSQRLFGDLAQKAGLGRDRGRQYFQEQKEHEKEGFLRANE